MSAESSINTLLNHPANCIGCRGEGAPCSGWHLSMLTAAGAGSAHLQLASYSRDTTLAEKPGELQACGLTLSWRTALFLALQWERQPFQPCLMGSCSHPAPLGPWSRSSPSRWGYFVPCVTLCPVGAAAASSVLGKPRPLHFLISRLPGPPLDLLTVRGGGF